MKKTKISRRLKERIAKEAQHRCGYCHTREAISGIPLTIEHIIPFSAGGSSEQENLCWHAARAMSSEERRLTPLIGSLGGRCVYSTRANNNGNAISNGARMAHA